MKIVEIKEVGFYIPIENEENKDILNDLFGVIENDDEAWLKEDPDKKLFVEHWEFEYNTKSQLIRSTNGVLYSLNTDFRNVEVKKYDGYFEIHHEGNLLVEEL